MSKRQVIILWAVAAVLAAIVLIVKLSQDDPDQVATERKPGETLFESLPATKIAKVVIEGAKQTLTLVQADDQWVVVGRDNYPADTTAVLELIRTVNNLEVSRGIEAGPSLAPRFGMDADADGEEEHGIEIGFFDKSGDELARVTLGKTIENAAASASPMGGGMAVGRYVRNHADESGFYATNEMFSTISDEAARWLRDVFISPEKIESVSVTATDSEDTEWHLRRDSEEAAFHVVDGKPNEVANASLANRLGALFSYARFDDVVPKADVEKRSAKEGKRKAVIKTFEGFTYTISLVPTASSSESYLMSVEVAAELPSERKKAENEEPADAKAKDEAFAKRLKHLQDKLNEAKFFEGRTYVMGKSNVDLLLNGRGDMVTTVQPKPAAEEQPPEMLTPVQPGAPNEP